MSPRRARALDGRVGDDPAAALREHLIDTAEQLLGELPVSAVTTRDIARKAGVSDGVLYNYFEDKTELVVAALVRRYDRLVVRLDRGLLDAGKGAVEANLEAFASAWLDLLVEAVPMVAGLLTEPVLLHRLFDEIHRQPNGPQYLQQRVVDYIAEEQRLGRLAADVDAASVATLVMGSTVILALVSHLGPTADPAAIRARVRPMVDVLSRGLLPAPGRAP
jgi:AcrR family transcriptional regulator